MACCITLAGVGLVVRVAAVYMRLGEFPPPFPRYHDQKRLVSPIHQM